MLSFFAGAFAVAGLAAATGPIIIHLLNRRRFRVVRWAAMDFLREALRRHRRILRVRDILLLALRTSCVLLFGLAMARPYLSRSSTAFSPDEPVHAIVVVDNSLSMGYETLDGTILDAAKARARELIESLPQGSWYSVLPLCGSSLGQGRDAYRTREAALEALSAIEVVDREGTALQAADLALEAAGQAGAVPSKRVVFIGDQQAGAWPSGSLEETFSRLPDLQIVEVGPGEKENAWIDDFRLRDGVADVETPSVFVATIRYEGPSPRSSVAVTLRIEDAEVATQTVSLEPGQSREVVFAHLLEMPVEPGRPTFVRATVGLEADRLPADDHRSLVVPVVAALPCLFVDQHGNDEDPLKSRWGETYPLRRLLVPAPDRGMEARQLIRVRQARIDELDRRRLEDARVVTVAGVPSPGAEAVTLLRDWTRQGGQLIIAAGAEFDARAWSDMAWLDGRGILPLPLDSRPLGSLPEEASGTLRPFFLDVTSLAGECFLVEGVAREEIEDLYRAPLFFKAVRALPLEAPRPGVESVPAARSDDGAAEAPPEPESSWLLWRSPELEVVGGDPPAFDEPQPPRVLASFTNGAPFVVERAMERGRVVFISSGIQSSWSTLARTDAVLVLDRIFRAALDRTLPRRNFPCLDRAIVRIDPSQRLAHFVATRPDGSREAVAAEALGPDAYGVPIRRITQRGHYRLTATREGGSGQVGAGTKLWEVSVAANGPGRESDLRSLDQAAIRRRLGAATYRWVSPGDPISIQGSRVRGEHLWKYLMGSVLTLLIVELVILAWPGWRGEGGGEP